MISIIIPACNEEAVIERCLRPLLARPVAGGLDIVVACNGCRDRTRELAAAFGPPVRVLETERASKIAALNLGDAAARGFPRIYLDADVEVCLATIERVAAALDRPDVLAAAPRMAVDTAGASLLVKAFYAVWLRQPYHRAGMIGGGFYALSEAGRRRFAQFPEVIADDEYVRALFAEDERMTLADCSFAIRAPRTLADLVRVKTRSRLGLYQLHRRFPELARNSRIKRGHWWDEILPAPRLWPAAAVYLGVNLATRARARRQLRGIARYRWERDDSSRRPAAGALDS